MYSRKPIGIKEITTNMIFKSMKEAEKYFNLSNGIISRTFAKTNVAKIDKYIFKIDKSLEEANVPEVTEVSTGKKFTTLAEACRFFEISPDSARRSITQNRYIKIRKGKYRNYCLKFERINNSFLSDLLNDKLIIEETDEVITVDEASRRYNMAPYKINECVSFYKPIRIIEGCIHLKRFTREEEDRLEEKQSKKTFPSMPIYTNYDIFFNSSGEVILSKDNEVKRFKTPKELLMAFDKCLIEIIASKEKLTQITFNNDKVK